ncbi:MAG: HAD hydrolase-like protein [Muribaculaceae bacterium]|nr:HAD hydrolase-like protein [Muribaculaceae bacterium]
MKIKNIIFDFDGTLADTSKLIVATMKETIKEMRLPYRSDDEIKSVIGVRLPEIPTILWHDIHGIEDSFEDTYRKNFEVFKDVIPIDLFPGIKETLQILKEQGINMSIATSRSNHSVEELTDQLGIRGYFRYLLGGDNVLQGKPNPESIYKILRDME